MPGDLIVMSGGRIGKDGIHGATFSSEEFSETSPTSAVQIGDPITQKKLTDFLLVARDKGLYHAITDNGAGGSVIVCGRDGYAMRRVPYRAGQTSAEVSWPEPVGDPALRGPGAHDAGHP